MGFDVDYSITGVKRKDIKVVKQLTTYLIYDKINSTKTNKDNICFMRDFLGYKDLFLSTKKWYNILRLLSPTKCMICGDAESISEGPFCEDCYKKFEELLCVPCPFCGVDKEECECGKFPGIRQIVFLFWYRGDLSTGIVSKVKYLGERRNISYLGSIIARDVNKKLSAVKLQGVCYVPRTANNIEKVGFDQSKLLAESVAFHLGIPVSHCIERRGRSGEQKKLSGEDRRRNVRNKFLINKKEMELVLGSKVKNLLLIDDVVTTGATIRECSYLLRKSGVSNMYAATVAKTPFKKRRYKRIKKIKKK